MVANEDGREGGTRDDKLYCIVKQGAMPGFSFIEPCALG